MGGGGERGMKEEWGEEGVGGRVALGRVPVRV